MTEETPLIPDQRRELLLKHLQRERVLSVHQLTDLLEVSHMTVRRDIATLEREGRVVPVPGGVRIAGPARHLEAEESRLDKARVEPAGKAAMAARAAAEVLTDRMTVYLDAGTTIAQLVPHLVRLSGMTVVTNDFAVVDDLLASGADVEVIHTGGAVDRQNRSSVGILATAVLERIALDVAFVSSSSWDLRRGVTTPYPDKVAVKQAAMASASESVLVAGSSKYGRFGMYRVCELPALSTVVTDAGLDPADAAAIREAGVNLVQAG
ncbi:DeoR/GlpR family DNA-binding transcription regulator [Kineosporia succinea]|uniref:DeoR/GlpR family transcriptional regulator of sugar metabolism n=1 Tax=Kineosporia succinea TaxID=84632 RepID=A0ABT9PEW4_9ACTN|nr:DeoR/GlpR family DNA-binding transcription regulator [Kineosporia succinea]MDP9831251.1 DeoR/GlpR family transcriptional regulator of sugar metabolism [Kineosporia succinea]